MVNWDWCKMPSTNLKLIRNRMVMHCKMDMPTFEESNKISQTRHLVFLGGHPCPDVKWLMRYGAGVRC